jgi:hypothetical protein
VGTENDLTVRDRLQALLGRDDAHLWLFGIGAVVLAVLPFALSTFWTRIALGALMWIGLAQSWNMIGGYAGYLDFGHGAYFGVGAFVTGIVMVELELPFVAGLLIAGVFCAVLPTSSASRHSDSPGPTSPSRPGRSRKRSRNSRSSWRSPAAPTG